MALRLQNRWVWDFWLVHRGTEFHIFYLQAPRSLQDPDLRHWSVSIGHAVSDDLRNWTILPDALAPDREPAWDDYTTWTGSVIQHGDEWYLFYTGSCRAEDGLIQRIGLATSKDLMTWERHPNNPVIEADPRWYEQLNQEHWSDLCWRDPHVFQDPHTGEFHAYITARVNHGRTDERGVIAHARSTDLLDWQAEQPVTDPGEFAIMEVPQQVCINGRYYLLFCNWSATHSARRVARTKQSETGTHYLIGQTALGPYEYIDDPFFVGDVNGSLYSGKLVQDVTNRWVFLAFRNHDENGNFVGEIIDPVPVEVHANGNLSLVD